MQAAALTSLLPPQHNIRSAVERALAEDIGAGDVTAQLLPADTHAQAELICRDAAIICGTAWAEQVCEQVESHIHIDWRVQDGDAVSPNTCIAQLHGPARGLLTAERTLLNFLQTLSGTATLTRHYVDALGADGDNADVKLLDTRKTLPGLRAAQKYAVACGGGHNHRHGLFDAFLLKENHIHAAGGIAAAVAHAKQQRPELPIIVEIERREQLEEALAAQPDRLLLDNFTLEMLRETVQQVAGRVALEASGNISLKNIRQIAATGVNFISLGALTKNLNAIDFSLLFRSTIQK